MPSPRREPTGAGQESVWDYPRPPVLRRCDRTVTIMFGGREICRAEASWQVLETSHPPTYYLPVSAFAQGSLRPAAGSSLCEWKGRAGYLDVVAGTAVADRAGWFYPTPSPDFEVLVDHVAVYAAAMDRCAVGGTTVVPQPGGFYGGWITPELTGPFKGVPGSQGW